MIRDFTDYLIKDDAAATGHAIIEVCRGENCKTFEVLVEGVSKKSSDEMFGRSSQNKVIVFPAKNIPIGSLIQVKIKDCTSATLIGEIANTQ